MLVIDWNGSDLPEALKRLPAGRYVIQKVGDLPELTQEEEDRLITSLESLKSGRAVSHEQVRTAILKRWDPR